MSDTDLNRKAYSESRYFILFLIVSFGYFSYIVYEKFLFNMVVAYLLLIGTANIYTNVFLYIKNNIISTVLSTMIVGVFFFFPIYYFVNQSSYFILHTNISDIVNIFKHIQEFTQAQLSKLTMGSTISHYLSGINPEEHAKKIIQGANYIGQKGVSFIADVSVVFIFYFLFLYYHKQITSYFHSCIPMKTNQQQQIMDTLSSTMSIVYSSTVIVAILEGFLFGFILSFFHYDAFLFGVIYGFMSLVPIIGGIIVWVPVVLYELSIGNTYNAIIISTYTIVVISVIADTFVKPMIISYIKDKSPNSQYEIHAYVIFFSILAGMSSFGFWGIMIGPAVSTIFLSLIYIYKDSFEKR